MQKFLGQGLNWSYSSNQTHSCDPARFLTHLRQQGTPRPISFEIPWFSVLVRETTLFTFSVLRSIISVPGLSAVSWLFFLRVACCARQQHNAVAQTLLLLTRSLPKHERLVDLHGSVIDYNYGGGSSIAVLLIMERLHRDLYTGLKVRWARRVWEPTSMGLYGSSLVFPPSSLLTALLE